MSERILPAKSAEAYRTIGEAAEELKLPQHVLRFWETRFPHIKPLKRAGGRRFYRPDDVALLLAIKTLLYGDGYTIKGVQRLLQEQGPRAVAAAAAAVTPGATVGAGRARSLAGRHGTGAAMRDGDAEDFAPPVSSAPSAPPLGHPIPVTATPAGEPVARPRPDSPDILARLEAVGFELRECERLLAAARPARE